MTIKESLRKINIELDEIVNEMRERMDDNKNIDMKTINNALFLGIHREKINEYFLEILDLKFIKFGIRIKKE